METSNFNNTC